MNAVLNLPPRRWEAELQLGFQARDGETILATRRHRGPLRVQRPFYPETRQVCHVYLLHPPGGLVSGDELMINIEVASGAHALLTTPGAGKYYRSDGLHAVRQQQTLQVAAGGTLEWLPQEGILYDGARAELGTRVELTGDAHFLGWEISCLGRPASRERLELCDLRQRFELWRDDRPLWLERSRYRDHSPAFTAAWGLRGHTVTGTLVCTNRDHTLVSQLREAVTPATQEWLGITQLDEVLVCRYLGDEAQRARQRLSEVWRWLRPRILGREAVAPRIWNT